MPISIASFSSKIKQTSVDYDGEALSVWYRPNAVTPRSMRDLDENENNIDKLTEMILSFVHEWDVLDEHGQRMPVSKELMMDWPLSFLNAVLTAVIADMSPEKTTGGGSFAG